MQKPIICDLDEQIVSCNRAESDRFAYTNYFNPIQLNHDDGLTPILPFYQKDLLRSAVLRNPRLAAAVAADPQWTRVLERNGIARLADQAKAFTTAIAARTATVDPDCGCLKDGILDPAAVVEASGGTAVAADTSVGTKLALDLRVSPVREEDAKLAAAQAGDSLLNLVKSELGYLFLDRTRIRPTGFAVGEHVYTLSMAPGEELVMEQKTFSKRQVTFEQQDEREEQYDVELASTLSTELQEGLEWQSSRTATSGFSAGGSVGGNIKGVDVGVNLSYSNSVVDASSKTGNRSVKDSSSSSSRVASRYRTQHKITFKVSSEEGFESTAKRVVKNPNRFTPVALHYFKILQTLQLTQERYGVRLCWAPAIKDPGFDLFERIRQGRESILARVSEVPLPPKPVEPVKPDQPPVWGESGEVEADDWGATCDMSADYDIEITAPDKYLWDGDKQSVKDSVVVRAEGVDRGWGYWISGEPWAEGDKVKVKVHVGVDWQVFGGCGTIWIRAGANFLPGPDAEDPEYREAYKQWQQDMKVWTAKVATLREEALRALRKEADAWEERMLRSVNPVAEMMNRIIQHHFAPTVRDESWEIDFWQQVFDWDAAGYALYPSWWGADGRVRDPIKEPTHFFNASWAKMYVPVRIGFERQALRWIFGKVADTPLEDASEAAFQALEAELRAYRAEHFGSETETPTGGNTGEPFVPLATWSEKLPTDGTHVEVVQSMTHAADAFSRAELEQATAWQAALLAEKEHEVALLAEQVEGAKQGHARTTQEVEALRQQVELRKRQVAAAERDLLLAEQEVEAAKQGVELLKQEVETARREVLLSDHEVAAAAEEVLIRKHQVALQAEEVALRRQDVALRGEDVALRREIVQSAHHDQDLKRRAGELIKGSVGVQVSVSTMGGMDGD